MRTNTLCAKEIRPTNDINRGASSRSAVERVSEVERSVISVG